MPGRADEFNCGLDLGSHRAGGELGDERTGLLDAELAKLLLRVRAEVAVHRRNLRQDHQPVCVELAGEEGGGPVLVDHGVEPCQAPVAPRDRDSAAAAGDRDRAAAQ